MVDRYAHLAQVDRHIAEAEQHVRRQKQLIERLSGREALEEAQTFLMLIVGTLKVVERHRLIILDRLQHHRAELTAQLRVVTLFPKSWRRE
jgi:hypothetical protein